MNLDVGSEMEKLKQPVNHELRGVVADAEQLLKLEHRNVVQVLEVFLHGFIQVQPLLQFHVAALHVALARVPFEQKVVSAKWVAHHHNEEGPFPREHFLSKRKEKRRSEEEMKEEEEDPWGWDGIDEQQVG